jgi:hypothetical protein
VVESWGEINNPPPLSPPTILSWADSNYSIAAAITRGKVIVASP